MTDGDRFRSGGLEWQMPVGPWYLRGTTTKSLAHVMSCHVMSTLSMMLSRNNLKHGRRLFCGICI